MSKYLELSVVGLKVSNSQVTPLGANGLNFLKVSRSTRE